MALSFFGSGLGNAATLTGSFTPIVQGSIIDLTTEGKLDWVHWGYANGTSLNRKATVPPQISNFTVLYQVYTIAYQQTDNPHGFSWADGLQVEAATNTTTGAYVFGASNQNQVNGFQLTVPADTSLKTLKVYVGTYGARGRFEATLSDHATSYSDTSLNNATAGPGGFYTLHFAANSSNQTLTIRWTVSSKNNKDANVTLQAATLSAEGANNPPFARITRPEKDAVFVAPADIELEASAFDVDGSVARVEFRRNGILMGEGTGNPVSLTMSNVAPGWHQMTAHPFDQTGATSSSRPLDVFVHTSGGALDGSVAVPPTSVDLTSGGTLDWVHWGITSASSVNRKHGVPSRINMTTIGTNALQQYADNYTGYEWSDGTPTASASGTKTGVFLIGIGNGFQLSVPADTAPKTLKVYVGVYGGAGKFQAWLSDFSAPVYTDGSVTNDWGNSYAVYTLNYTAASNGQTLNVRYTADSIFDQEFGNVTLQAAALSGTALILLKESQAHSDDFTFSFETDLGRTYTVYYSDSSNPMNWQILTTINGTGAVRTVTDSASHPQRFYRIQMN